MKIRKHSLILLLLIIYSWVSVYSFASFMTNDCCKQSDNTSHCSCKTKTHVDQSPCENVFSECSTSETFVIYDTTYKHLNKSNTERSGINSVNVVTLKPDPSDYVEYTSILIADCLYCGWFQYRSPPSVCA